MLTRAGMPTETQNSAGGTGRDALSPNSETDSAASTASSPCLRNAATAAPGEKVASLESADESVRAYDEDEIVHTPSRVRASPGRGGASASASAGAQARRSCSWSGFCSTGTREQPTSYIALLFFST